jgi:nitrogen fixation protein FixH
MRLALPARDHQGGRDRWIPWAFVAFFGVVLLANGIMLTLALVTFPGLETEGAYQRGLAYNRNLDAAQAQTALGWKVNFRFSQDAARHGVVTVDLRDRHGSFLQDAAIQARFVRPTHAGHDLVVEVPHQYGGRYVTEVGLPLPGQWEVRITASAEGETYRLTERIRLDP